MERRSIRHTSERHPIRDHDILWNCCGTDGFGSEPCTGRDAGGTGCSGLLGHERKLFIRLRRWLLRVSGRVRFEEPAWLLCDPDDDFRLRPLGNLPHAFCSLAACRRGDGNGRLAFAEIGFGHIALVGRGGLRCNLHGARSLCIGTWSAFFCHLPAIERDCGAALAAFRAGVFDAVLAAFGKDSTLTGRTYLWNQAIEIGARNPTFGLGYNAFWTHGRPEAEQLWEEFFITGRTGFHFHNLLIESYVALGILGLILVGGICVLLVAMPITAILQRRGTGSVMICSGLSLLFLVRSGAEVDFITAYTAGSFLVSFVIVHLFDHVHIRTKTAGWRGAQAGTSDLSGLFQKQRQRDDAGL